MPDGALIISPDRSAKSFYREIIIKKPHLFKIACLKEIKDLFCFDTQPFYAGFGNRDTDYISYKTLGVDVDRIYIINPKSEIKQYNSTNKVKTYPIINEMLNVIFPKV